MGRGRGRGRGKASVTASPVASAIEPPSGGPTDPYFANVSLLLQSDTTNGSTVFTDQSSYAHTITAYGDVEHRTASYLFSPSSIYFDGTLDRLGVGADTSFDFGTGNWTIEFALEADDADNGYLITIDESPVNKFVIFKDTDKSLRLLASNVDIVDSSPTVTSGWTQVEVGYDGTTTRMFFDGVLVSSSTASLGTITSDGVSIGNSIGNPLGFTRYMEAIRITKGVCRHPADTTFIPPTTYYPTA